MNAATANPQIDIAYGKEPREFLAQSVGFENELIGQTNFPPPRTLSTWLFSLTGRESALLIASCQFAEAVRYRRLHTSKNTVSSSPWRRMSKR